MSKRKDSAQPTMYKDINLDDLLSKLTTGQLEDLHTHMIDPDDSMTAPSDRCRYKTDKTSTGDYNRKRLLNFLEKKAKEEKDWEEEKPFTKEKRGKVWKVKDEKEEEKSKDSISTEWDNILTQASEAELVDLAAILGFHGMLNQVQYHQAFVEGKSSDKNTGFQSVAQYSQFKAFDADKVNNVNIDELMKEVKENKGDLKEVNLNNMKKVDIKKLCELVESLEKNTVVTSLQLSNTRATDKVVKSLVKMMKGNKSIQNVNIESNYISGAAIVSLLKAVNNNQVLKELRLSNQKPQAMGVQNEMAIASLIKGNQSLLKLGVYLEIRTARLLLVRYIERNIDNIRKSRRGETLDTSTESSKDQEQERDSDASGGQSSDED